MWPLDRIRQPSPPPQTEQLALLREQNSLLRELIQAITRQPARTPRPSPNFTSTVPPALRPPLTRQYTADDVFTVTPERRRQLDHEAAEKRVPWRTTAEQVAALRQEPYYDSDPTGPVHVASNLGAAPPTNEK